MEFKARTNTGWYLDSEHPVRAYVNPEACQFLDADDGVFQSAGGLFRFGINDSGYTLSPDVPINWDSVTENADIEVRHDDSGSASISYIYPNRKS